MLQPARDVPNKCICLLIIVVMRFIAGNTSSHTWCFMFQIANIFPAFERFPLGQVSTDGYILLRFVLSFSDDLDSGTAVFSFTLILNNRNRYH